MAKIMDISKRIKHLSDDISDKVSNVSDSVKTVISEYADKVSERIIEDDSPIEINTIQQLNKWISSVQPDSNSSVGLLMQAQFQALNQIETSILSGMVIDNILVCLYKALEIVSSEHEKREIRESFAAMLQSVIFISEARLQYEIKKNKEEAIQMLSSAGNLISQSVNGATGILVTMTGAGAVARGTKVVKGIAKTAQCTQMLPIINNVVTPKLLEVGTLSHLLSAKKKQAAIEERMKDHTQMLKNLFKTLDRYSDMIGPSIQIHGMLSRYSEQLNDQYIEEQNYELERCTTRFASQMIQIVNEMSISLHDELDEQPSKRPQRLAGLIDSIKGKDKNYGTLRYDEIIHIYNFLKERYNSLLDQIAAINADIIAKQEQYHSLGIFHSASKITLATQLDNLTKKIDKLNISLSNIDEKVRIVENLILPVKKKIEDNVTNLQRITEKYAIC